MPFGMIRVSIPTSCLKLAAAAEDVYLERPTRIALALAKRHDVLAHRKAVTMTNGSESLAQAIAEWSLERPIWEQNALRRLALAEPISEDGIREFAEFALLQASGTTPDAEGVTAHDLSFGSGSDDSVALSRIADPQGINALLTTDSLDFNPTGLTLIFGENGSGKSGYARILKRITRSRHQSDILTNVFEPPAEQSARVSALVGATHVDLAWPTDNPTFLRRVSFYDAACADRYISADNEVAYRPQSIALLDSLVGLSSRVRADLLGRRQTLEEDIPSLPTPPPGTRAARFISDLSAETTQLEIDKASEYPNDLDKQVADLRARIESLQSTDIDRLRDDLTRQIESVEQITSHISDVRHALSASTLRELSKAATAVDDAKQAAAYARSLRFESEAVPGVGSASWKLLWEAARRFSQESAFPDQLFPNVQTSQGKVCVLCHQSLSDEAIARFHSFEQFVSDDTQQVMCQTQNRLDVLSDKFRNLEVFTTATAISLNRIERASANAHSELQADLAELDEHRLEIVAGLNQGTAEQISIGGPRSHQSAEKLLSQAQERLQDIAADDREAKIAELHAQLEELLGFRTLRDGRFDITSRLETLRSLRTFDAAIRMTDTRGITRRAATLIRTHVSDVLKHRFSQETGLLGLRTVSLADAGGGQGNLLHRAQLVGAVQRAPLDSVLSEGEQTALGLAGFLTEVDTDSSGSATVFDDPVTSLDHVRREKVAQRLVELAATRQVIIFTHDLAFVVDLKRFAESDSIEVSERWVTKRHRQPGSVSEGGPWDAQTVRQRIHQLNARVPEIRLLLDGDDPDAARRGVRSWYQDLRLVWERAIWEAVLHPVVVRGRLEEVRPTNLRVLAQFTEDDNQEIQTAFTRCGDRGSHDRSSEFNRPLPAISELEYDLDGLREWHARVRRYQSS